MKNKNGRSLHHRQFTGMPVSPGIAVGKPALLGRSLIDFPKYWIHTGEVRGEIRRFHEALGQLKNQLDRLKSKLCRLQGQEQIGILDTHLLFLKDELLVKNTVACIEKNLINAEWAASQTINDIIQAFSKIDQAYFRERKFDLHFVEQAILRNLMGEGKELFEKVPKGSIVVAHDLSPAEMLHLIRYKIGGVILSAGGLNSHTAILARSLKIPCVMGIEKLEALINETDLVLLDGNVGKVLVNPRVLEKARYEKIRKNQEASDRIMRREVRYPATTLDGQTIELLANMEFLDEIDFIREYGAHGVGLYRTEFLFLDRKTPPSLEEQEEVYKKVLKRLKPREVTIRTLDLGAEKIAPHQGYSEQGNPALGLRAIRYCLRDLALFTTQLKALYRASVHGNLKICFPMISSTEEFRQVKKVVGQVLSELKKERTPHNPKVPLGVMIETPSAVLEMDLLAFEVDFFSVGTNDLIQYLLAVDRNNELVASLYSPLHPSVIRSLKQITDTAQRYGKEVTLCGEMAGEPVYLLLLVAMGFDRLSMNAVSIPRVKKIIRQTSLGTAQELLGRVLANTSAKENKRLIYQKMGELFPEYFAT